MFADPIVKVPETFKESSNIRTRQLPPSSMPLRSRSVKRPALLRGRAGSGCIADGAGGGPSGLLRCGVHGHSQRRQDGRKLRGATPGGARIHRGDALSKCDGAKQAGAVLRRGAGGWEEPGGGSGHERLGADLWAQGELAGRGAVGGVHQPVEESRNHREGESPGYVEYERVPESGRGGPRSGREGEDCEGKRSGGGIE